MFVRKRDYEKLQRDRDFWKRQAAANAERANEKALEARMGDQHIEHLRRDLICFMSVYCPHEMTPEQMSDHEKYEAERLAKGPPRSLAPVPDHYDDDPHPVCDCGH